MLAFMKKFKDAIVENARRCGYADNVIKKTDLALLAILFSDDQGYIPNCPIFDEENKSYQCPWVTVFREDEVCEYSDNVSLFGKKYEVQVHRYFVDVVADLNDGSDYEAGLGEQYLVYIGTYKPKERAPMFYSVQRMEPSGEKYTDLKVTKLAINDTTASFMPSLRSFVSGLVINA